LVGLGYLPLPKWVGLGYKKIFGRLGVGLGYKLFLFWAIGKYGTFSIIALFTIDP